MGYSKGAVLVMLLLAAGLAGFGAWQFGGIGLTDGEEAIEREHGEREGGRYGEYEEDEDHEEYEEYEEDDD
ncbi:MAG TPA: hypothetical protein VKA64_08870 [Gammaproteobacteria bacterium]|nr:hypothetical protein [Gammaproteobacteria bacterium]